MPPEGHEISNSLLLQALNDIGALGQQIAVVQGQNTEIINEQRNAAAGRRETHERLRQLEMTSARSAAELERIGPLVDGHEKAHQRSVGMVWLVRALWLALAGLCGAAGALATLFGLRPH
jgi:hypothetical protein